MTFECLHIDKAVESTCIEAVDCFDVADCGAIGDSVDRVAVISAIGDKISVVVGVSVVVSVVVLCVFVVVGGGGGGGVVVLGVVAEAGVVDGLDDSSVIALVLKVDECFAVDVEKLRSPLQLRLRTALTVSTIIINMMYANNLVISV